MKFVGSKISIFVIVANHRNARSLFVSTMGSWSSPEGDLQVLFTHIYCQISRLPV
jgi:hypothetical protein